MATDEHQDGTFQPYRQHALSISACHVWPPIGSDHHHHHQHHHLASKTITGRHIVVHRVGVLPQQAEFDTAYLSLIRCC